MQRKASVHSVSGTVNQVASPHTFARTATVAKCLPVGDHHHHHPHHRLNFCPPSYILQCVQKPTIKLSDASAVEATQPARAVVVVVVIVVVVVVIL